MVFKFQFRGLSQSSFSEEVLTDKFFQFIFYVFFFLISSFLSAQSVWYFGNGAGLDFSHTPPPKPVYDGKIFTNEGCAVATDDKGNLLFYTDGIKVWNSHHQVLSNGEGLNGNRSATQSALVVPVPGDKNIFYIFTVDEKAGEKGLCYSMVDVKNDSVIQKNKQLLRNSTEKLTAIVHANGKDVWLIAHEWGTNNFHSFAVTESGVHKPVISSAGIVHDETGAGNNREAIGYMCASDDGKKLAVAVCYKMKDNLQVFDFDNVKGVVINPITIQADGFPYGLCFSPDHTQLYVSFLKGQNGVIQYDMAAQTIIQVIDNEKENSFGSLQLGPDGKIYVTRTGNFLDAIESPDAKGILCKYKKNAINLSPASSTYGLPNFLWNYADKKLSFDCSKILEKPFSNKDKLLMIEAAVCENTYILNAKNSGSFYNWSTMETTQKVKVDSSGIYRVSISKNGCTITDSIRLRFRKDAALFRFLPTFNPENDFLNSEFYYEIDDIQEFELKVFDKKKKNIFFETTNPDKKWNGKNSKGEFVSSGEYFWSVKYKPNCPKESKLVIKEGKVTVKRIK